jgi:hypothetical protein
MSHYRSLIEKLSVRHVERDDFEELSSLANEAMNEVPEEERKELERHAMVVAATALSRAKGNAKAAVETLKGVERQMVNSVPSFTVEMRPSHAPLRQPLASGTSSYRRTISIVLYSVVAFLAFIFLIAVMSRRG